MLDQTDIEASKLAVTRAIEAHGAAYARLFASDGKTPISGPDLHARQVAAIVAPLEREVDKAVALADRVVSEVEKGRLSQYADPMAALDLANLELAATHRVFVAEDCASLPVPDLVGRLQWAAAHPGKYYGALYRRYGLARFQALLASDAKVAGVPELRSALEALGAIGQSRGLSPEQQRLAESAAAHRRWAVWQLGIARDPEKAARDKAKSAETIRSLF